MHCLQCIDNYGVYICKAYEKGEDKERYGKKEQVQSKDKAKGITHGTWKIYIAP